MPVQGMPPGSSNQNNCRPRMVGGMAQEPVADVEGVSASLGSMAASCHPCGKIGDAAMRHDLISGDQRRTAMRPSHSDLTLVMSTAGQAINALPLTRRPAFDAPQRRLSRTVPRWPSLVIGHYRRYARPKRNCVTWSGLPASCPRCSSLVIMSLALPARNPVCRSAAATVFGQMRRCVMHNAKSGSEANHEHPGFSSGTRFNAVAGFPRLGSRSRLPQTCHSHQTQEVRRACIG